MFHDTFPNWQKCNNIISSDAFRTWTCRLGESASETRGWALWAFAFGAVMLKSTVGWFLWWNSVIYNGSGLVEADLQVFVGHFLNDCGHPEDLLLLDELCVDIVQWREMFINHHHPMVWWPFGEYGNALRLSRLWGIHTLWIHEKQWRFPCRTSYAVSFMMDPCIGTPYSFSVFWQWWLEKTETLAVACAGDRKIQWWKTGII